MEKHGAGFSSKRHQAWEKNLRTKGKKKCFAFTRMRVPPPCLRKGPMEHLKRVVAFYHWISPVGLLAVWHLPQEQVYANVGQDEGGLQAVARRG